MGQPSLGRTPLSGIDPAERWSQLHHGIDPKGVPLLLPWLRLLWWLARPLRGVPPTAITVLGAVLAVDAAVLAANHPGWAALAVVLAALCDGLDGAVAVVAGRATRSGAVADALAGVSAAVTSETWPVLTCAGIWCGLGVVALTQAATGSATQ